MRRFRMIEEDAAGRGVDIAPVATSMFIFLAFVVVPLLQPIGGRAGGGDTIRRVEASPGTLPAIAPAKSPEPEEKPPELAVDEMPQRLDIAQLEIALQPSGGAVPASTGDLADIARATLSGPAALAEADRVFSTAELDRMPRAVSRAMPRYPAELRQQEVAGRVLVGFVVAPDGSVRDARVEQSSNIPAFDQAALAAVRQWKFEPGRKGGRAVAFRMRAPITFRP